MVDQHAEPDFPSLADLLPVLESPDFDVGSWDGGEKLPDA